MNKLNLFSEIYGSYYSVVAKILEQAEKGMTREEIESLIKSNAFYDSAFYLAPKIFSKDWNFLEEKDKRFFTNINLVDYKRPLTNLELSWLKTLLQDKRILLFLSKEELNNLNSFLLDTPPMYSQSDFHYFDIAKDGDNFSDENYIKIFKNILYACNNGYALKIKYLSSKNNEDYKTFLPYKISYSSRDDKFRLICLRVSSKGKYSQYILNISRIESLEVTKDNIPKNFDFTKYIKENLNSEPITLRISTERSALERCMLQLAFWEKETEYDEENDCYICKLFYNKDDETELLIRILSFGPVIKVLGHENFLKQVKERVFKQNNLNKIFLSSKEQTK